MQHAHGASLGRENEAKQVGGILSVNDFGSPRVTDGLQDDDRRISVGHLAHGLGDELESLLLIGALQHRRG